MKSTIILTTEQAQQIKSGEDVLIMELLDQPPEGYEFNQYMYDTVTFHPPKDMWTSEEISRIPLQYPVGLELKIKLSKKQEIERMKFILALPVAQMEQYVIAVSNMVKRVQELTDDELCQLRFTSDKLHHSQYSGMLLQSGKDKFIDYFNSRFARPRKEGDGYVCYPYDKKSWYDIYKEHKNFVYPLMYYEILPSNVIWKGKPLIIKANPYLELFTVRVVEAK